MDFKLSDEQKMIKANMREFAQKYVEPIAEEIDESGRYPEEAIKLLGEKGYMGMPFPEEYGGAGTDYLTYAIAVEELSRSCAATGFTMSVHTGLACGPIALFGNEEQKKKYLTPMAKGEHIGAFALTEPGAGTDVGAATTRAVLEGDEYVINGSKTFTSNGPVADTFITFAWTNPEDKRKGMSAFIIEKGTPGLSIGEPIMKMGIRASQTSSVFFNNCRVPKENLIGNPGDGLKIAMSCLDHGRIGIAAQAVGIAQAALDESLAYSKERIQFGRPISKNQAIQWMLADMETDINAGRFLYYYAAYLKDQGQPFSKAASMAKLFCSEMCFKHAAKAVQIFGGYGYCKGQKVERLLRDAKITEIYEGTSEAQRMNIASNLLR
ncbi:MAG: acyl-CoA dehydrogenase [Syntrophomonadaceae bacterium]|jgi:butyryl-CoA dehydrogenase|nr:acyl-CoA dehydrogenase [Bacillota bacterium]NLM89524.1 acyl-CoA dehydrogenase [Syntrophomonadaceae bacterium]HAA08328.1 acyl-CoA dehydrogenase [Syntrophomonas sp.]HQA50394.1 acyl-CoA dehydrogenase [Syntrophomonadaceae bacterium]HQD91316.1 acyl-CoA dehydrogenase [Syntrophomonadaceae bacterium]